MQQTHIQSLGQEDPLEKEMAIHFSILAWRNPWTEEPGGLQSTGLQRVGPDWATITHSLTVLNKITCTESQAAWVLSLVLPQTSFFFFFF